MIYLGQNKFIKNYFIKWMIKMIFPIISMSLNAILLREIIIYSNKSYLKQKKIIKKL